MPLKLPPFVSVPIYMDSGKGLGRYRVKVSAGGAAGFSDDEITIKVDSAFGELVVVDAGEHEVDGGFGDGLAGLAVGGKGGLEVFGVVNIVDTDDGDVAGDGTAEVVEGLHEAGGGGCRWRKRYLVGGCA